MISTVDLETCPFQWLSVPPSLVAIFPFPCNCGYKAYSATYIKVLWKEYHTSITLVHCFEFLFVVEEMVVLEAMYNANNANTDLTVNQNKP